MNRLLGRKLCAVSAAIVSGALALGCVGVAGAVEDGGVPSISNPQSLPEQEWHSKVTGPQNSCSREPIYMAYYRTWRDVEMVPKEGEKNQNVIKMTDIPEGIDILSLFHVDDHQKSDEKFWDTFEKSYRKELRERKTRIIRTIDVSKILAMAPKDSQAPDTEYIKAAQAIVLEYVDKHGLDGLDIDVESEFSASERVKLKKMYRALSLFLGPKSESGKLLIMDTNKEAEASLGYAAAAYVDYIFYQSYQVEASQIQSIWLTYSSLISSCQFVIGYANEEENDTKNFWGDSIGMDVENSKAIEKAKWQPHNGIKGGYFEYAIDRNGLKTTDPIKATDFRFTKRAIAVIKEKKLNALKESGKKLITEMVFDELFELKYHAQIDKADTFDAVKLVVRGAAKLAKYDLTGEFAPEGEMIDGSLPPRNWQEQEEDGVDKPATASPQEPRPQQPVPGPVAPASKKPARPSLSSMVGLSS